MQRLPLLLFCAVLVGMPGSARALPINTVFDVVLPRGPDPSDAYEVGSVSFRLIEDLTAHACRYSGAWSGEVEGSLLVAPCALDELKTHGHASCEANGRRAFSTVLVKDPRADCSCIDPWDQPREVFMLVAGESADPVALFGIVQWTAAAPIVWGLEATARP